MASRETTLDRPVMTPRETMLATMALPTVSFAVSMMGRRCTVKSPLGTVKTLVESTTRIPEGFKSWPYLSAAACVNARSRSTAMALG